MHEPMPAELSRDEVLAATAPLYDLLRLTPSEVYEIQLVNDRITVRGVPRTPNEDPTGYPKGIRVPGDYVKDDPRQVAELAYTVDVAVRD